MNRKVAKQEQSEPAAKSYYSQAFPESYGKDFTQTIAAPAGSDRQSEDKKLNFTPITKDYKQKDQNKADASTSIKSLSKSWQDQDHGVYHSVVEAADNIITKRFAKFKKALATSAEAMYKNIEGNPLREALYNNFKEAGFDADTSHYIVESAFDEGAQGSFEKLVTAAEKMFDLEIPAFAKQIVEIGNKDKVADLQLADDGMVEVAPQGATSTNPQKPAMSEDVVLSQDKAMTSSGPYRQTSNQPASFDPEKGYRQPATEDVALSEEKKDEEKAMSQDKVMTSHGPFKQTSNQPASYATEKGYRQPATQDDAAQGSVAATEEKKDETMKTEEAVDKVQAFWTSFNSRLQSRLG